MNRIVYVSPDSNTPTGGIKVIYKHVELLVSMGYDACVMHFQRGFRCDWFANTAPVICLEELQTSDFVLVPEIMTILGNQLHGMGMRYGMFVQNGYLVLPTAPMAEVEACYRNASVILSISDDTTGFLTGVFPKVFDKVAQVRCSVDPRAFSPIDKALLVTYMPRKLPQHAMNVVPWIARTFPDWEFLPLHGLSEAQVAQALARSRVFLAFGDLEGLGLPPIEAALAGNVVLGYPAWGGLEFWREPNFRAVAYGDLRDFARKFYEVAAFARQPDIAQILAPGMDRLSFVYGAAEEQRLLRGAMARMRVSPVRAADLAYRPPALVAGQARAA